VEDCIGCGATHSHHWEVARVVKAMLNGHSFDIEVHRCGDCAKVPPPKEAA